jgi:hypothetical protein
MPSVQAKLYTPSHVCFGHSGLKPASRTKPGKLDMRRRIGASALLEDILHLRHGPTLALSTHADKASVI